MNVNIGNEGKYPNEYLNKPYSRVVIPDVESGTYTAQILEFPGCITQGGTPQEAYERLEDVALSWVETALEMGQDIPLPWSNYEYGGKIALRLPKSLHKQVSLAAERDGTSVNQFIVMALSEKVASSKLYYHLMDEFERRLTQTATSVAGIIIGNIVTMARTPTTTILDTGQFIPIENFTNDRNNNYIGVY